MPVWRIANTDFSPGVCIWLVKRRESVGRIAVRHARELYIGVASHDVLMDFCPTTVVRAHARLNY